MGDVIRGPWPANRSRPITDNAGGIHDQGTYLGIIECRCGRSFSQTAGRHEPKGIRCPHCSHLHTFASLSSDY